MREARGTLYLDHPGPFFGFSRDEFAEIGGRSQKWRSSEVGKTSFEPWAGEADGRGSPIQWRRLARSIRAASS
jgi:hypothetical protein